MQTRIVNILLLVAVVQCHQSSLQQPDVDDREPRSLTSKFQNVSINTESDIVSERDDDSLSSKAYLRSLQNVTSNTPRYMVEEQAQEQRDDATITNFKDMILGWVGIKFAKATPLIGGFITWLLDITKSGDTESIWDKIKDKVQNAIYDSLDNYHFDTLRTKFNEIRLDLGSYLKIFFYLKIIYLIF